VKFKEEGEGRGTTENFGRYATGRIHEWGVGELKKQILFTRGKGVQVNRGAPFPISVEKGASHCLNSWEKR